MGYRSPNKSQYWYCVHYKKRTEHIIPNLDSDHVMMGSMSAFQRWHRCKNCYSNLRTYEIMSSQIENMLAQLDQLNAMKAEHEKLIEALRSRKAAQGIIDAILSLEEDTSDVT